MSFVKIVIALFWVATPLFADLPVVRGLAANAPIVVDGVLDEDAWRRGEWYSGFKLLDMPEREAEVQTRFKVRFDEGFLYVGVEAEEPNPGEMVLTADERDGKVFRDDCVEVMVDPTGERIEYYHFAVNAKGVVYDAQRRQGGHVYSAEWDGSALAATQIGEAGWTVELRIPVVELGLTAASAGEWAIDVARERQVAPRELSTFAPLTGGFHQPALYPALRLEGADFDRYLWEVGYPHSPRLQPGDRGRFVLRASSVVKNAGSQERRVRLRGLLEGREGEWVEVSLVPGEERICAFQVADAEPGRQRLMIELAEGEELLARKSVQVDLEYAPLAVEVLEPSYRNSVYATQELKELVFGVRSDIPQRELNRMRLRVELKDPTGRLIARLSRPAKAILTTHLPFSSQPSGDYRLELALIDSTGEVLHESTEYVTRLPRVAHEWRIDEEGVLLHNGEKVLPFGWFSIPPEDMKRGDHAFNLMQWYSAQWQPVEGVRQFLDRAVAAGTAVAIYPYPDPKMMANVRWGKSLSGEEAEGIRQRVRALKDHPGLFAWYMADEPELRPALPERCRQIYEVVSLEDPYHPCIMLNDTMHGIFAYREGGDVLMPDPYPCFIQGGLAAQPIEKVGQFIRKAVEAGEGRRAVWITPQGFNYGDYGKRNQRGPNLVELRNQLYQAVVYGAKGFLWYTYGQVANYPALEIGMRWLSFEVADLKEAILAPVEEVEIGVEAEAPEHVHVSARRVGDEFYLFAVNTATREQKVRLRVEGMEGKKLYVVSEDRRVSAEEEGFEDRFGVYETHVYTTDEEVGKRERIDAPLKEIEKADRARKKKGNLAFEEYGTEVEVSSKSRYGSTPGRLFDGVTGGMRWRDGTPGKGPDWLVVRWPEAVEIGRLVIFSDTIAGLEAQVMEDGEWIGVGRGVGDGGKVEVVLDEKVKCSAVRIVVETLREGEEYAVVYEVEAYRR